MRRADNYAAGFTAATAKGSARAAGDFMQAARLARVTERPEIVIVYVRVARAHWRNARLWERTAPRGRA